MVNTPDDRRAVVWSEDPAIMAAMEREEFCGRQVHCNGHEFSLEE
jgi:hypothetical protein